MKRTKREEFLAEMEQVVPWQALQSSLILVIQRQEKKVAALRIIKPLSPWLVRGNSCDFF